MHKKLPFQMISYLLEGRLPGRIMIEVPKDVRGSVWLNAKNCNTSVEINAGGQKQSVEVPDETVGKELVQKIMDVFESSHPFETSEEAEPSSFFSFIDVNTIVSAGLAIIFLITFTVVSFDLKAVESELALIRENSGSQIATAPPSLINETVAAISLPKSKEEEVLEDQATLSALMAKYKIPGAGGGPLLPQATMSEGACPSQSSTQPTAGQRARSLSDVGTHNAFEFFKHNQSG